jgi:hypothetical protein
MDFPIIDLLDDEQSIAWLEQHFHPTGHQCPHWHASRAAARFFRINRGSGLPVYRCLHCQGIDNLYSDTVFAGSHLAPVHVVLLLRGTLQGQPSAQRARDSGLTEQTVVN